MTRKETIYRIWEILYEVDSAREGYETWIKDIGKLFGYEFTDEEIVESLEESWK